MRKPLDHTWSWPLAGAQLRVLSLGAGVQSTTIALMASAGEISPAPDCAIFADTQSEPAGVYEHLDRLEAALSFPIYRVTAGSLRAELLDAAAGVRGAWGRPPLFIRNDDGSIGMTRRQCTQDYKIEPIRKKVRELVGLRPRQHGPKFKTVEQWIGISTDERIRMKRDSQSFVHNRWPLMELGISREDCVAWLAANGWPGVPKSACTFCPYHSDAMWRDLRDNDPASWADAVHVDESLRSGQHILLKGKPHLHRKCVPLREVDLRTAAEKGSPSLFHWADLGMQNECEGMCGL